MPSNYHSFNHSNCINVLTCIDVLHFFSKTKQKTKLHQVQNTGSLREVIV